MSQSSILQQAEKLFRTKFNESANIAVSAPGRYVTNGVLNAFAHYCTRAAANYANVEYQCHAQKVVCSYKIELCSCLSRAAST